MGVNCVRIDKPFEVIEFTFLDNSKPKIQQEFAGLSWSRPYEYNKVLLRLNELKPKSVHNTCMGPFKDDPKWGKDFWKIYHEFNKNIEKRTNKLITSDLFEIDGTEPNNYCKYDILTKWLYDPFDVVLNISVLEHLANNEMEIAFNNLLSQVKPGGSIIFSFDYPRVNLTKWEQLLNCKCKDVPVRLNGNNSMYPNDKYSNLNIIYLEIKKGNK